MSVYWRVLWQIENTGTLYTVPTWFTCTVSEIFIVNINASAIKVYTINVVKKWDVADDHNTLAKNVQIQVWYFWDRMEWLNMPLAEWDSIIVDSNNDVVFQVFWYEITKATSTWSNSQITAIAGFLNALNP